MWAVIAVGRAVWCDAASGGSAVGDGSEIGKVALVEDLRPLVWTAIGFARSGPVDFTWAMASGSAGISTFKKSCAKSLLC